MSLKGKTLFITGASRGIGKAIALRAARDGANVAIAAKTSDPNPKLAGTIYSAAEEIRAAGGKALPIQCDIRDEASVKKAIEATVAEFGGIDIVVNNASAISLTSTDDTTMKKYDLMHQVNTRGTYMVSKYAVPYLRKSKNPHILNLSAPLDMDVKWFAPHVAYTMAKFGMSMCVLGMAEEFRDDGVAVNALWPLTIINTAALQAIPGASEQIAQGRVPEIMADAAHIILTKDSKTFTGNFCVDEIVLREHGVQDLRKYLCDPKADEEQLIPDFFVDEKSLKRIDELRALARKSKL
ncbi:short-chain dehydrogenase/reductase SDR [Ramicandelaber brevisporus]|nr:short-chain dehydrogenase/reductase SDR [Ramicandelaber brevisporus]